MPAHAPRLLRPAPDRALPLLARGASGWTIGSGLTALIVATLTCGAVVSLILIQSATRCYVLEPPLNRFEQVILAGPPLDCLDRRCWATIQMGANRGLACFYSQPGLWPGSGRP
jgi:hypothetical protein